MGAGLISLDAEDHATLDAALAGAAALPGDCGDEYRRPPFLTASGKGEGVRALCTNGLPGYHHYRCCR